MNKNNNLINYLTDILSLTVINVINFLAGIFIANLIINQNIKGFYNAGKTICRSNAYEGKIS